MQALAIEARAVSQTRGRGAGAEAGELKSTFPRHAGMHVGRQVQTGVLQSHPRAPAGGHSLRTRIATAWSRVLLVSRGGCAGGP